MNYDYHGNTTAAQFIGALESMGLDVELLDIATLLQTEPREATVDAIEARQAAAPVAMRITAIDTATLDHLLAPYINAGVLRTQYERITGATEYRSPTGRLLGLSIGAEHFAAIPQPMLPRCWNTGPASHGTSDNIGTLAKLVADIDVPAGIVSMPPPSEPSLALHMQQIGRIKRVPQPVQWALENPMTGEIIKRGEFPGGDE